MARELQAIQTEYNVKCAELGQAIYRTKALEMEGRATEKQIDKLIRDIKKLNIEAAQASGKEVSQEEQAAAEEVTGE